MFGSIVSGLVTLVEDAVDVTVGVVTLGEYGEVNKDNVSRLIAGGMTIYTISQVFGVSEEILREALNEA